MRGPDDLDVIRDGLALVEAAHHDDLEGARAVLDNCRARPVAMFLARVACDLVEDPAAALVLLREYHAGG